MYQISRVIFHSENSPRKLQLNRGTWRARTSISVTWKPHFIFQFTCFILWRLHHQSLALKFIQGASVSEENASHHWGSQQKENRTKKGSRLQMQEWVTGGLPGIFKVPLNTKSDGESSQCALSYLKLPDLPRNHISGRGRSSHGQWRVQTPT